MNGVGASPGTFYSSLMHVMVTNAAENEAAQAWQFISTDWKGFEVTLEGVMGSSTLTIQRRRNFADVGLPIVFDTLDTPGTKKTDPTVVPVTKADRLSYKWIRGAGGGPQPTFNAVSYLEFADGLWGF